MHANGHEQHPQSGVIKGPPGPGEQSIEYANVSNESLCQILVNYARAIIYICRGTDDCRQQDGYHDKKIGDHSSER